MTQVNPFKVKLVTEANMSDYTVKLVLFFIVVCSYIQEVSVMKGSLCYLRKNDPQSTLCIPVTMDNCSSDYINVTSVMVYDIQTCSSVVHCQPDKNCCSTSNVTPTRDTESMLLQCYTKQCLTRDLKINNLPITSNFNVIEFTFNCVNDNLSQATTQTTATHTESLTDDKTTLPERLTRTSSSNGSTKSLEISQDNTNSGDSQTGVYVAVPVVLVLLVIALAAIIFLWRRRLERSKQTQNAESKDYFSTPAQNEIRKKHVEGDSASDESGFGDYSEINSEQIGESMKSDQAVDTEYNTLNLRDLPTHSDPNYGFLAAKNSSADETYSRIQDEKPAETDNMYSHIGGAAKNISDDVIIDHTYNTAVIPKLENGVINEGEDTYNHLDADINEKIRDKDKVGESDYSYSKFNSQIENKSENTDEPVRHDYFVLEKEF